MALKAGKRTVKLKPSLADNIGIPKFADTNIAAEISKPISEAIDSFRKVAEADAASAYKADFNAKTRDHYINLQEKFKCFIGFDYPEPIVDQGESSKFAKNLIYSARKTKNFKKNSEKVFNKLGSRKNNTSSKRIKNSTNKNQLSLID